MSLTNVQRKCLLRLAEGDCDYTDILRAGGNGRTITCLMSKGLIAEHKMPFGRRLWRLTADGSKKVRG